MREINVVLSLFSPLQHSSLISLFCPFPFPSPSSFSFFFFFRYTDGDGDSSVDLPTGETVHTFDPSDFGFSDVDTGDSLQKITIDSLPDAAFGKLVLEDGSDVAINQVIECADYDVIIATRKKEYRVWLQFQFF